MSWGESPEKVMEDNEDSYLQFEPPSLLVLPFGADDVSSVTGALTMKNVSSHPVAYKFRTNNYEAYLIHPSSGIISPNDVLENKVQLVAGHHPKTNDILEISSVPLDDERNFPARDKAEIRNFFKSTLASKLQKHEISLTQGYLTFASVEPSRSASKLSSIWTTLAPSIPSISAIKRHPSSEKSPVKPPPSASKESSVWSVLTTSIPSIFRRRQTSKMFELRHDPSSQIPEISRDRSSKRSALRVRISSKISAIKRHTTSEKSVDEGRLSNTTLNLILTVVLILLVLNAVFFWKFSHEMTNVCCTFCRRVSFWEHIGLM